MLSNSGIYQIKNLNNGKVYIGSAINIERRWKRHKKDLNNLKHHSQKLQRSWNKYGEQSFEFSVIEYIDDKEKLIEAEQQWIDESASAGKNGYNISPNAGSTLGVKHSEETRKKYSEARKGIKTIPCSEETKSKIGAANKGKVRTEAVRKKYSEAKKGKPSWNKGKSSWSKGKTLGEEHKRKIGESNKGKQHSEEAKIKMSEAGKGKIINEETKRKISKANKGRVRNEEARKKYSEARKGVIFSDEHKRKLSEALKEYYRQKKLNDSIIATGI